MQNLDFKYAYSTIIWHSEMLWKWPYRESTAYFYCCPVVWSFTHFHSLVFCLCPIMSHQTLSESSLQKDGFEWHLLQPTGCMLPTTCSQNWSFLNLNLMPGRWWIYEVSIKTTSFSHSSIDGSVQLKQFVQLHRWHISLHDMPCFWQVQLENFSQPLLHPHWLFSGCDEGLALSTS